jgi:hypothetical protein
MKGQTWAVAYPGIFFSGGLCQEFFLGWVQQIQLRAEGRENRDLGALAPSQGVPLNLQMSETCILIRLLRMYFHRTGNLAQLCQNFGISGWGGGGGFNPPWYATERGG